MGCQSSNPSRKCLNSCTVHYCSWKWFLFQSFSFFFFSIIKFREEKVNLKVVPKRYCNCPSQVILLKENISLHCTILFGKGIKHKKQWYNVSCLGCYSESGKQTAFLSLPVFRKLSFHLTAVPEIQFWAGQRDQLAAELLIPVNHNGPEQQPTGIHTDEVLIPWAALSTPGTAMEKGPKRSRVCGYTWAPVLGLALRKQWHTIGQRILVSILV